MAQRIDLRLRHLGVRTEHELHRVARNQPDHQEADQRHAERYEQQIAPAMEQGPAHYLPMVRLVELGL
jgi:hypothetical protein